MIFAPSYTGRLSRRDWWLKAAPAGLGLFILAGLLDEFLIGQWAFTFPAGFIVNPLVNGSFFWGPFRLVLGLAFLPFAISFAVRRLHDLDTDAALLWAGLALIAIWLVLFIAAGVGIVLTGGAPGLIGVIAVIVLIGASLAQFATIPGVILLALLGFFMCVAPGDRRENRFGPDPLATA